MTSPITNISIFPPQRITAVEQMERLSIADKISQLTPLIPDLAAIVSDYARDSIMTNWYTALERMNILPHDPVIEPLPENIEEIMESPSPTHHGLLKPDGTFYKIKEVGVFYLVPPHSFEHLDQKQKAFWKDRTFKDLYACSFSPNSLRDFDGVEKTYRWVWMTKTVLPGNIGRSKDKDAIEKLNRLFHTRYEIPSLKDALPIQFLHRVATGETLYKETAFNQRTQGLESIYTFLQESLPNFGRLTLAGTPEGIVDIEPIEDVEFELGGFGVTCKDFTALGFR